MLYEGYDGQLLTIRNVTSCRQLVSSATVVRTIREIINIDKKNTIRK